MENALTPIHPETSKIGVLSDLVHPKVTYESTHARSRQKITPLWKQVDLTAPCAILSSKIYTRN